MNMPASSTLELDFCHPSEAAIVLRAIIAAYTGIRENVDASSNPEISEHVAQRLVELEDCLVETYCDLAEEEGFIPGNA